MELVDMQDLGSCVINVWVRLPSPVPIILNRKIFIIGDPEKESSTTIERVARCKTLVSNRVE